MSQQLTDRADISFRPITPNDEAFLSALYASTRQAELEVVDWTEAQKADFLKMQFNAQHTYYQQQFKQATFDVILLRDQPIGRLYVDRQAEVIHLIDIALLPDYRNSGIGTLLLEELLAEARQLNKRVSIHVEQFNPAMHLYKRLGFVKLSGNGVYDLMEWKPTD